MKRKKLLIPLSIVVLCILGIFMVKLIRQYANQYHESQKQEDIFQESEESKIENDSPAKTMKLVCKEDKEIVKRLQLPRGSKPIEQELKIYPNYDDTVLVEEGFLKANTENEVETRFLVGDVSGRLFNSFYKLQAPPIIDEYKHAVHKVLNKKGEIQAYIADAQGNKKTDVFDNIEKMGNFYKAEITTYDAYGPLFVETTIYNKNLQKIYKYNNNKEKPTDVKLICKDSALLVNDNNNYFAINEQGLKITLDNTVKTYSDAFDCIYFRVPWNTGFKETYRVYNIMNGKYYDISLSDDTNSINLYAFNFYKKDTSIGDIFVYNGQPIDTQGMIKSVAEITQSSPKLVFIGELQEPENIQYQTLNYAMFSISGGRLQRISKTTYTDIVSSTENLYKPLVNTFYLKEKRENASGGFYNMLRNDGVVLLDSSKKIVNIGEDAFEVKKDDTRIEAASQDDMDSLLESSSSDESTYKAYLNSKTMNLVSKDELVSRIFRNLAGWENWIIPEKPQESQEPQESQKSSTESEKNEVEQS